MTMAADCRRYGGSAGLLLRNEFCFVYAMLMAEDCRRYGDVRDIVLTVAAAFKAAIFVAYTQ
jgi:hypothetical protein